MGSYIEDNDDVLIIDDLRDLWLFIRRNAFFVALVAALCVALAVVASLVLTPRYKAQTMITLDPRKTTISDVENVVSSLSPDPFAVRSEMDVLESRAVIDRVVNELGLLGNPEYNTRLKGPGFLKSILKSIGIPDVVFSDEAVGPDKQKEMDQSAVAEFLSKNLKIDNDGRSYNITVIFKDENPEQAARIANAIADQYLINQLDVRMTTAQKAGAWLQKRLDVLRDEVEKAEKAVEDYKRENNLISVRDETSAQQQLTAITPQLLEARAARSQAEARLKSIEGLSRDQLATSSMVMSSELIGKLKEQEAEVRRKVSDLSTRYGDMHPTLINARSELDGIRDKIKEEADKIIAGLKNDYDIAKVKVESLERELIAIESATSKGNEAMVQLRQLQRDADTSRKLYEEFLGRSKQITEQQDLQVTDARIVARAETPLKPYFPRLIIFIVLGGAGGVFLGFAIAFLREYMDRGFRALTQIENMFHVQGLGLIPIAEAEKGQSPTDYVLSKPLSNYAEAYRSVRTAIHFSNVDAPPKVLLITSSFPKEGKSVFVTSFARILALSGSRVLLIDGDMRRSSIKKHLSLDETKPDLAMILAHDATVEQAIQRDPSGADVIIANSNTPNLQELLGSKQMEHLLDKMRALYDFIIIDTPPIIAVSDMAMVAKYVDATIYLVKWASTPREVVAQGLKQMKTHNVKLAGVVLTQVNLNEQKQYGYGDYGYYYGKYKDYYVN